MRRGMSVMSPQSERTLLTMDSLLVEEQAQAGVGLTLWEDATTQRLAAHQQRLLVAADGVPLILWVLLILGSAITILSLFVYVNRSKPGWAHAMLIITPLFIVSAALVVMAFFDHPYANAPGAVTAQPMEHVLKVMTTEPLANLPTPSCPTPQVSI
jgi:hypothetical protein